MKPFMTSLADINICYLVLVALLLIVLYLFLRQKPITRIKRISILLIVLIISIYLSRYFNGVFQSIFDLKYLSVKTYLLIIVTTNIICLITMNKQLRFVYSVLNYTLFILIAIFFISIIIIVIGNYFEPLYTMDIQNTIALIDLSLVIFIIYMIIVSLTYIGYTIILPSQVKTSEETSVSNKIKQQLLSFKSFSKIKKKTENKVTTNILTPEELLGYKDKNNFYINDVECSIIFEDSNQENIIKNYHILLKDINSKLVNGFTLKENQLLKSICLKLQIGDLSSIDFNNTNIINRISVEEYQFLKKILEIN